jgi:hypothetical protein
MRVVVFVVICGERVGSPGGDGTITFPPLDAPEAVRTPPKPSRSETAATAKTMLATKK